MTLLKYCLSHCLIIYILFLIISFTLIRITQKQLRTVVYKFKLFMKPSKVK